jgi:hypothetical protein
MENVSLSGPPAHRDVQACRSVGLTGVWRAVAQPLESSTVWFSPAWQLVAARLSARQSGRPGSGR